MTPPPPKPDAGPGLSKVGACPACGSRERTFLFDSHDWIHRIAGLFALQRCGGCRSVYPDPRPDAATLPSFYPEHEYYAYASPTRHRLFDRVDARARAWYALRRGVLSRAYGYELGGSAALAATLGGLPWVRRYACFSLGPLLHPWRRDGALLDVGCGAGSYLDLMRALGWKHVVGVDISATAIREARETLGLEAHCGDVRDVRLPAATFDAVSLSHTLEHVDDPVEVLAEVRRVMKPGGRVAIEVPNVRSLNARIWRQCWLGLETPRHLINFSRSGVAAAVETAGLRVESLTTSAQGSWGVALFSLSRARGDSHATFTDATHRFPPPRRAVAATIATLERALCAAGLDLGEKIWVVARR